MVQITQLTSEQIAKMRKLYDIPENFVPVATAPGVIAWVTEKAARGEA